MSPGSLQEGQEGSSPRSLRPRHLAFRGTLPLGLAMDMPGLTIMASKVISTALVRLDPLKVLLAQHFVLHSSQFDRPRNKA